MRLLVDKHRLDKGFTLIEMIFVLFLVSIILLMFPMFHMKNGGVLRMQVESLRYNFLEAQANALHKKQSISIICEGNSCRIGDTTLDLKNKMKCYGSLSFNENGNASRATTFHCSIKTQRNELIVQLGSGRMYVR